MRSRKARAMKTTATDIYEDLRELQSRMRDLPSSDAQQQALRHAREAQLALLPLVQGEEDHETREHMRQRARDAEMEADERMYMEGKRQ